MVTENLQKAFDGFPNPFSEPSLPSGEMLTVKDGPVTQSIEQIQTKADIFEKQNAQKSGFFFSLFVELANIPVNPAMEGG